MADVDFKRARELYTSVGSVKVFKIIGAWPQRKAYAAFVFWIIYLFAHMSLGCYDLVLVSPNLALMVSNLSEFALEVMIVAKMCVLRFSKKFARLIVRISDGIDPNEFNSNEEKESYLEYNRTAIKFYPYWYLLVFGSTVVYHMRPLAFRIQDAFSEEKIPFELPYRARFFVPVNDSSTFWIAYLYQTPLVFPNAFYGMTVGYVCSMVIHVCGLLSALAVRIKNIDVQIRNDPKCAPAVFRDIVERHKYISSLATDINSVFKYLLLEELVISTVILALTAYSVLLNSDEGDMATLVSFFTYVAVVVLLIYSDCITGEYLIIESSNVCDAYYQCEWYDLSDSVKKQLILCMNGAKKPLELSGGGIYVYNAENFTGILKSAMGYISMLRAMV